MIYIKQISFIILFLFIGIELCSQNIESISYTEFWNRITTQSENEEEIIIENLLVTINEEDLEFAEQFFKDTMDIRDPMEIKNVTFKSVLEFEEESILGDSVQDARYKLDIENINWHNGLSLNNISGIGGLYLRNCKFSRLSYTESFVIENCEFEDIYIGDCDSDTPMRMDLSSSTSLTFSSCNFHLKNPLALLEDKRTNVIEVTKYQPITIVVNANTASDVILRDVNITSDSEYNYLSLSGRINELSVTDSKIATKLRLNDVLEISKINVENSEIDHLWLSQLALPDANEFNFRWDNLKYGILPMTITYAEIVIHLGQDTLTMFEELYEPYYILDEEVEFDSKIFYDNISFYKTFQSLYQQRGDRESANACFVKIKELETAQQKYYYKESGNPETWLNWKLNQFLSSYVKFGTQPTLAIFYAIRVMLFFSFFYFFFHSSWDKISLQNLLAKYQKIKSYFTESNSLNQVFQQDKVSQVEQIRTEQSDLKNYQSKMPYSVFLTGNLLYRAASIFKSISVKFWSKFEILHGKWNEKSPLAKKKIEVISIFSIFVYGISLIAYRFLNSLTLSINAFSTLGFGNIPVKGLSRYVAIVEGFIGWFLLSIFSVSLISQFIQS